MKRYVSENSVTLMIVLGVVACISICHRVQAEEVRPPRGGALKAVDQWSCVFGGQVVSLRYAWDENSRQVQSGDWHLKAGNRIIVRGALRPTFIAAQDGHDHVAFSIEMPPVKPGVVVSAELSVSLQADDGQVTAHDRRLYIFASDPFVDRLQWLRELKIQLYDPDGKTTRVFQEHGIPFRQLLTAAAIDETASSILILGEGLKWNENSGVIRTATLAAQRGRKVLCLAPQKGEMRLYTQASHDAAEISSLYCSHEAVVRRFDKRFDTREWLGGPSALSRLGLVSERDGLVARVLDSSTAWPWIEMRYSESSAPNGNGTLIVCGFGIIKYWNDGPVPRYLMSAILESLQSQPSSNLEGNTHAVQ